MKEEQVKISELKFDSFGLIPVAVTEEGTNKLLMLAYMNLESLTQSLALGQAVFFSRTRQELWHKGKTSGNFLEIKKILVSCYKTSLQLVVKILGDGLACHTGSKSCFYSKLSDR